MSLSTHNGTYSVPFAIRGDEKELRVYAHDSGQRLHWSFSADHAVRSCNEWLKGNFPHECVGTVDLIPFSWISPDDEYVGD
jgi:hypothetical protein